MTIAEVGRRYELLPVKLRLFIGMLIAANTAALAIKFSLMLALENVDYFACLGVFLAYRVFAFMANPAMPLTSKNVQFMSEQRILWNVATIAVLAPFAIVNQFL